MSSLTTYLRSPIPSLDPYDALGMGATGVVYPVSDRIVVKVVYKYENPSIDHQNTQDDSRRAIKAESAIYDILSRPQNWHPNIIFSFLRGPNFIFLERLRDNLFDRTLQRASISQQDASRWTKEIASAEAWLEEIGIAHGDLRPPNILIDQFEHVKLCDFDCAIPYGQYIQGAHSPFYQQLEDGTFGIAGSGSEQFAIGSCIYYMSKGFEPVVTKKGRFSKEYPPTADLMTYGAFIDKCWKRVFPSIAALKQHVLCMLGSHDDRDYRGETEVTGESQMTRGEFEQRVRECESFIKTDATKDVSAAKIEL